MTEDEVIEKYAMVKPHKELTIKLKDDGDELESYIVKRCLGVGASWFSYEAIREKDNKRLVIKEYYPQKREVNRKCELVDSSDIIVGELVQLKNDLDIAASFKVVERKSPNNGIVYVVKRLQDDKKYELHVVNEIDKVNYSLQYSLDRDDYERNSDGFLQLRNPFDESLTDKPMIQDGKKLIERFKDLWDYDINEKNKQVPLRIPRFYGSDVQGATVYCLYRYTAGQTVKNIFDDETTDIERVLKVLKVVASGMCDLEKYELYATDGKPSNIQVTIKLGKDEYDNALFFDFDSIWKKAWYDPKNNVNKYTPNVSIPFVPPSYCNGHRKGFNAAQFHSFSLWMSLLMYIFKDDSSFNDILEKTAAENEKGYSQEIYLTSACQNINRQIQEFIKDKKELKRKIKERWKWKEQFIEEIIKIIELYSDNKTELIATDAFRNMLIDALNEYQRPVKQYSTMAFAMAHSFPVYRFLKDIKKDIKEEFDIAFIGKHEARGMFFAAYLSSVQHLVRRMVPHSTDISEYQYIPAIPIFRFFADDAFQFFENYVNLNPELKNALEVTYVTDSTRSSKCMVDINLVGVQYLKGTGPDFNTPTPFARVFLYETHGSDELHNDLSNSRYIIMFNKTDSIVEKIKSTRKNENIFIGVVDDQQVYDDPLKIQLDKPTVFHMSGKLNIEGNESSAIKEIKQNGFIIHMSYSRGLYGKKQTKQEAMNQFADDPDNSYNFLSSLRSAATIRYKLWSLELAIGKRGSLVEDGMGHECDPEEELYKLIYKDKNNLKNNALYIALSNLEHRSWCAWLAANGYLRPETYLEKNGRNDKDAFMQALYKANNAFKSTSKGNEIHSALVAGYRPFEFRQHAKYQKKNIDELDPLDQVNCANREYARLMAEENRGEIYNRIEIIEREKINRKKDIESGKINLMDQELADQDLISKVENLIDCVKMILQYNDGDEDKKSKAKYGEVRWKRDLSDTTKELKSKNKLYEGIADLFSEIEQLLRPQIEYNKIHDFRDSDADIINSLPMILTGIRNIVLHRPIYGIGDDYKETELLYKTVIGAILLDPDYVDLFALPDPKGRKLSKETEEDFRQRVDQVIKDFGRFPEVPSAQDLSDKRLTHVFDLTGVPSGYDYDAYIEKYSLRDAWQMRAENGTIKMPGKVHRLFGYPYELSVFDMCQLYGLGHTNKEVLLKELNEKFEQEKKQKAAQKEEGSKKDYAVMSKIRNSIASGLDERKHLKDVKELMESLKVPNSKKLAMDIGKEIDYSSLDTDFRILLEINKIKVPKVDVDVAMVINNHLYLILNYDYGNSSESKRQGKSILNLPRVEQGYRSLDERKIDDIAAIKVQFCGNATIVIIYPNPEQVISYDGNERSISSLCENFKFTLIESASQFCERFKVLFSNGKDR